MGSLQEDLKVIAQIEKDANIKLERRTPKDFKPEKLLKKAFVGYLVEDDRITALSLQESNDVNFSELIKLEMLQTISLYNCGVKETVFLQSLTQLQTLDLGSNNISDYSFLKDLTSLQTLDLSSNKISDYSFLKDLTSLQTLDLSSNKISDYSFLKDLTSLQTLDLSSNNISDISFLQNLTELQFLNLRYNRISDISVVKNMKNLSKINCDDYKITTPPPEIVKKGIVAIREYLEAMDAESQLKLNEVKVLLVGDGGSGKTSLLKRLKGEDFNPNEPQTHGINIQNLNYAINGADSKIRVWDFGGQEIMHATHQFSFPKEASMY